MLGIKPCSSSKVYVTLKYQDDTLHLYALFLCGMLESYLLLRLGKESRITLGLIIVLSQPQESGVFAD